MGKRGKLIRTLFSNDDEMRTWLTEHRLLGSNTMGRVLQIDGELVREMMVEMGIPRNPNGSLTAGEKCHTWRGGRKIDNGYLCIYVPTHPYATRTGYVRAHRLVMESQLGRYLLPCEVVHHKDKNPQNNDPANLELYSTNGEHLKEELVGHCPRWTEDGLRRMDEAAKRRRRENRQITLATAANPVGSKGDVGQ